MNLPVILIIAGAFLAFGLLVLALAGPSVGKAKTRRLAMVKDRHAASTEAVVAAQMRKTIQAAGRGGGTTLTNLLPRREELEKRMRRTGKGWTLTQYSELSTEGAIEMQGFQVPALTIRRAETTVELGSGESFMIAGLMNNRSIGALDKMPGLGDVPLLGMLFKSDSFRRGETELVIVVTPYLVQPVSANDIKLPTDAFQDSDDLQRLLLNQTSNGVTGGDRPKPRLETTVGDADRPRGTGDATPGFGNK